MKLALSEKPPRWYVWLIGAAVTLAAFTYGLAVGRYEAPPFDTIVSIKRFALSQVDLPSYDPAEIQVTDNDIASIIGPKTADELMMKRKDIIRAIYGTEDLPYAEMPAKVRPTQTIRWGRDFRWRTLPNLHTVYEGTVEMEYEFKSYFYHFVPKKRTDRLMLIHQGHDKDSSLVKDTIRHYLERGYDLLVLNMPLRRGNWPDDHWVRTHKFGKVFLSRDPEGKSHRYIPLLAAPGFNPAKLFFHPSIVALNYALEKRAYKTVAMVGLSGGGWTTFIVPALDPRIRFSFAVAGGLPMYLRSVRSGIDMGDYEQYGLPLYQIANYLELYLLSSFGEGRMHVQILNANDPCCFGQPAAQQYAGVLRQHLDRIKVPGNFKLYIDETHEEHIISPYARDLMDSILNSGAD